MSQSHANLSRVASSSLWALVIDAYDKTKKHYCRRTARHFPSVKILSFVNCCAGIREIAFESVSTNGWPQKSLKVIRNGPDCIWWAAYHFLSAVTKFLSFIVSKILPLSSTCDCLDLANFFRFDIAVEISSFQASYAYRFVCKDTANTCQCFLRYKAGNW